MQNSSAPFGVRVVDNVTGRGVPLVELETTNRVLFVTDSNGWAAINEPGLFGQEVFFHVRSHGYSFPKDGFGYAGVRLRVVPGGRATVKIKRENIAERVCRLTGEGIYRDSVLLGQPAPLREPVLSAKVTGQDSALAVVYKGKMLWFWGDTGRIGYPLGNFRTTGAVVSFPKGRTSADAGLDFRYFTNADGFTREMFPSQKPGPIWIGGLVVLGEKGREEMYTHYTRIKDLGKRYEHGYLKWDDARSVFIFVSELPLPETWRFMDGHPIHWTDNGAAYIAGGFCFPVVRCPADAKHMTNPAVYEAFTCLDQAGAVQRDAAGKPIYRWQKDAPPISSEQEFNLVKDGKIKAEEAHFLPRDAAGKPVVIHGGSVTWNPYRKKWILIATQKYGAESLLGNIVYGEADAPTGPWTRAVKIITHSKYTFYNPVHHPFLDTAGGRIIYLEGTYTAEFSGNSSPTPRYDYNQILYRLDLSDVRLRLA